MVPVVLVPGEKRRIIVARQGTYKKNTKPCNVQVYNCGGGVATPPGAANPAAALCTSRVPWS
jgi:hypothetical protein